MAVLQGHGRRVPILDVDRSIVVGVQAHTTGETVERRAEGVLLTNVPVMPARFAADEFVFADAARLALALDRAFHDFV